MLNPFRVPFLLFFFFVHTFLCFLVNKSITLQLYLHFTCWASDTCEHEFATKLQNVKKNKKTNVLTLPMFDKLKVVPDKSSVPSLPARPRACILFSSIAISKMLRFWTFFMLGTSKPSGVSMAMPMLWDAWCNKYNKLANMNLYICK